MASVVASPLPIGTTLGARLSRPSRVTVKTLAAARPKTSSLAPATWKQASLLAAAALLQAAPARAEATDVVPVDSAVDNLIGAVKAAGELVKSGISAVESGVEAVKQGYEVAAPVVQQGVQTVAPFVQQAATAASEAASPVLKAALPALQNTAQEATSLLESTGLPLKTLSETSSTVVKTAAEGAEVLNPVASRVTSFLSSADPVTLGEYALGAVALLYIAPPIFGLLGGSFRGYAGEVTAASALDAVVNDSNSFLIDVRTQKEKESSGIPDVPSGVNGKVIEVEYAITEDKKLRGALRDPSAIEAQVTALQIASLKRINKGSRLLLLDRNGPTARTIAKELNGKGFNRVFVISGGFDGRNGWVQSKLQIKPAAAVFTSPPALGRVGTRKSLPAPKAV